MISRRLLIAVSLLVLGCTSAAPPPAAAPPPLDSEPGFIVGRVVDAASKRPVGDYRIRLMDRDMTGGLVAREILASDVSGTNGVFRIDPPADGTFLLVVDAPGFVPGVAPGIAFSEATPTAPVTVELQPGIAVTGTVNDPAGAPVAGAQVWVELQSPLAGPLPRTVTTDASGRFSFTVDPGDKTFLVTKEGSVEEKIFRRVAEEPIDLPVVLMPAQTLSGVVLDDTGAAIASARVRASWSERQGVLQDTTTGAEGRFTMSDLRPGAHKIEVAKGGYPRTAVEGVTLPREGELRIEVQRGSTVTGKVTGGSDAEVPYVFVYFGHGVMTGINREEQYGVLAVPPGPTTMYAEFIAPGVVKRTNSRRVVLENGGRVEVDLAFRSEPVITGRVVEDGKPADRAVLELQPLDDPNAPVIRLAADEGKFELTGIERGSYRVVSEGRELRSEAVVDLSASKEIEISVGPREMPALPGMPTPEAAPPNP